MTRRVIKAPPRHPDADNVPTDTPLQQLLFVVGTLAGFFLILIAMPNPVTLS